MLVLCEASVHPSALQGHASGVCFIACHGKMLHKVRALSPLAKSKQLLMGRPT